jgi:hypothetical protein
MNTFVPLAVDSRHKRVSEGSSFATGGPNMSPQPSPQKQTEVRDYPYMASMAGRRYDKETKRK